MEGSKDKRFAVLIDADNVSEKYIKAILDEISNDGTATYKRIYGDWTKPNLNSWKNVLLDNSITPIQQYGYTTGKNATDSAMIIDAMDILYSENVEGFCIVSSDSDFTRLASRLRESGMFVVGMGEKKTPSAFIAACNKFKYLEVISEDPEPISKNSVAETTSGEQLTKAILTILNEISDEDQWAFVGEVGSTLVKRFPDFDVRNYGYKKLTPFLKSLGIFEVRSEKGLGGQRIVYVREKPQPEKPATKAASSAATKASQAKKRSKKN